MTFQEIEVESRKNLQGPGGSIHNPLHTLPQEADIERPLGDQPALQSTEEGCPCKANGMPGV